MVAEHLDRRRRAVREEDADIGRRRRRRRRRRRKAVRLRVRLGMRHQRRGGRVHRLLARGEDAVRAPRGGGRALPLRSERERVVVVKLVVGVLPRSAARSDEWWPCITSGAVRLRRDALRAREVPGPVFICGKSMGAVGVGRGSATVNIAAGGRARRKNCARAHGVRLGCQRWGGATIGRSTEGPARPACSGANDGLDLLERVDRKKNLSSESVKTSGNRASVGVGRRARRAGQPRAADFAFLPRVSVDAVALESRGNKKEPSRTRVCTRARGAFERAFARYARA